MSDHNVLMVVCIALGIAFFIAEILTMSFYAFFISIGCLFAALFLFLQFSFITSLCAGAVLTLICIVVFQRMFQKKHPNTHRQKSPFEYLKGTKGTLSEAIDGEKSHGAVIIDGTAWRAMANEAIACGAQVVVVDIDAAENMTLIVKKLDTLYQEK